MKKLIFLLVLIFAFTACNADDSVSRPRESISHIQQTDAQSSGPHPMALLHKAKLNRLKKAGITVETANEALHGNRVNFDLVFYKTDSTDKITVPITGFVQRYSSHNEYTWGSLNCADGEIILTTLKEVTVYTQDDTGVLTAAPLFDISAHLPDNYRLVDTLKDGNTYYIGYMTDTDRGIIELDKSTGNVKNNIFPAEVYMGKYFGYYTSDSHPVINENVHIGFMDDKHRYIEVMHNGITQFVYNTEDKTPYDINTVIHFDNDAVGYDIQVSRIYKDGKDCEYFAEIIRNDETQRFYMSCDFVSNSAWYMEGNWFGWDYDDSAGILNVSNSWCGQHLTFDFNSKKVTSEYIITKDHMQQQGATSPDGRYTLYYNSISGGDSITSNIMVYDKNTDKCSYIAEIGGMYGAGSSTGFLANGDIYVMDYGTFNVYTADMQGRQPVFSVDDYLPAGNNVDGKGTARYLLSVCRNPRDFSYVVQYVELPEDNTFIKNSTLINSTYKFALIDGSGNIIRTIDTGVNVSWSGFEQFSMYLARDNVMHFDERIKGEIRRSFELNLDTGVCTQIK